MFLGLEDSRGSLPSSSENHIGCRRGPAPLLAAPTDATSSDCADAISLRSSSSARTRYYWNWITEWSCACSQHEGCPTSASSVCLLVSEYWLIRPVASNTSRGLNESHQQPALSVLGPKPSIASGRRDKRACLACMCAFRLSFPIWANRLGKR